MRIVLIGDSITFGDNASDYYSSWAGRLYSFMKSNYKGTFEIINNGVEGETASEGFEGIEDSVIKYTPDIVYIGYGINDCTKEAGIYVNDIYSFESNMEDLVKEIKGQTNAVIVFNLTTPVIEDLCNDDVVNIHNRDIKAYNDVVKRICANMTLSFVDHFHILNNKEDLRSLIDIDGIHPNDEGHKIIFESIISCTGHLLR